MLAADWSLYDLLALGLGYLLLHSFGLILTRLAGHGDVREIGSGDIGATNVLRTGNKKLAALTLILDALKGTAAVLIGAPFRPECNDPWRPRRFPRTSLSGLARLSRRQGCCHLYRRAARTYWPGAIAFCVTWLVVAAVARYSSLAALVGVLLFPACCGGSGKRAWHFCS